MFMSFGVSAMSCSRGVGMPPHRSSTALRSVMPALPRRGAAQAGHVPHDVPAPRRPPGAASPGRRPAAARSRCRSQSADEAAAASSQGKEPPATGLSPGPTALSKSPRSARAAETAPLAATGGAPGRWSRRRSRRRWAGRPGAAKQGRGGFRVFAAWGRDHQAGYAGDAGRHKQVRHGERAVFAAATFFPPFARRVGSSGARELRAFSPLVARAAGFGADDRREPPPRARGQRPECLLRQRRGLVPEPGRDHRRRERALPRVGAAAKTARSPRDARRRRRGRSPPKADSRAASPGASRRRRACLREKLEKTRAWERGRSGRRRVRVLRAAVGSRRFAAVRGCRETKKKPRASERIERRHAERKSGRVRGCRVSGNGGRSRRAPRHAGRGAETWRVRTWRVRCPRARAVSIAPRAGARARGDARLAARLSSHARAAGRGQHVEKQQCRGIRTSLSGDWGWVVVLVLEGHRVGRAGIAFHVLARRAVRVRAPVVGAGEGRAFDDFLPVLPPAIGVVAGHRGGGVTACAFSASGLLARGVGGGFGGGADAGPRPREARGGPRDALREVSDTCRDSTIRRNFSETKSRPILNDRLRTAP